MPAISLTDLQQQIAERERELHALRQELESRQSHLTELTRRKEELQRQLQQVEEEIVALAASAPAQRAQPGPVAPAAPTPPVSRGGQPRLGDLIVALLREAAGPRTARQLCEEAQRRGYQPSSQNPIKSVEARLQDLKSQGIVRRASGQPGYLLTPDANAARQDKSQPRRPAHTNGPKATPQPVKPAAAKKSSGKRSASSGPAPKIQLGRRGEQPPLREMLTAILQHSRKPLSAGELAEQILASGYRSDSKKFVKVIRTQLGKMAKVERVPEKGYRLQKKT